MRTAVTILTFVALLAPACTADDLVKQGDVGELCNGRDDDCRPGLVCLENACRETGPATTYDCDDICDRLGDCDAIEAGCASDCRITTRQWRFDARESFGVCLVEELTCDEARDDFAPQTCYSRIPIPEAREERCSQFRISARDDCRLSLDDQERLLEGCFALARVSRDASWTDTDACAELTGAGNCTALASCFEEVFDLESPLSL